MHVHLVNEAGQSPNHTRLLRYQNRTCLWQRQKRRVRLRRGKILPERLLQFCRIGIAKLKQVTDDVIAIRDLGFVGNDRHSGRARIFPCPDYFNNVGVFLGYERIAVEEQIHLDDLDRFLARHFFGDEDADLALNKIVHYQLFAGELLVKAEHVGDVAVWKLQSYHLRRARLGICRRDWRRRLGSARGGRNYSRNGWRRTRGLGSRGLEWRRLGRLRRDWRNLSKARTGRDKQQSRSMHGFNGGENATRCAGAGQFPSALPPGRRKVSAELDTTRDLILRMFRNITFPGL